MASLQEPAPQARIPHHGGSDLAGLDGGLGWIAGPAGIGILFFPGLRPGESLGAPHPQGVDQPPGVPLHLRPTLYRPFGGVWTVLVRIPAAWLPGVGTPHEPPARP